MRQNGADAARGEASCGKSGGLQSEHPLGSVSSLPWFLIVWLCGMLVRALDLRSVGRACSTLIPAHFRVHPWASSSHTLLLSSINLVRCRIGSLTVGLASHWPCVKDNSCISTYVIAALEWSMVTVPGLSRFDRFNGMDVINGFLNRFNLFNGLMV